MTDRVSTSLNASRRAQSEQRGMQHEGPSTSTTLQPTQGKRDVAAQHQQRPERPQAPQPTRINGSVLPGAGHELPSRNGQTILSGDVKRPRPVPRRVEPELDRTRRQLREALREMDEKIMETERGAKAAWCMQSAGGVFDRAAVERESASMADAWRRS